jgi:hypothetical protein
MQRKQRFIPAYKRRRERRERPSMVDFVRLHVERANALRDEYFAAAIGGPDWSTTTLTPELREATGVDWSKAPVLTPEQRAATALTWPVALAPVRRPESEGR